MKSKLYCSNPENVEFTLAVTMKLIEWENLRKSINDSNIGLDFKMNICDMIDQAKKVYYPKEKKVE